MVRINNLVCRFHRKNRKRGFTIVFSVFAVLMCLILVLGVAATASSYFKVQSNSVGNSGALYAADSALSALEAKFSSGFSDMNRSVVTRGKMSESEYNNACARYYVAQQLTKVSANTGLESGKGSHGSRKVRKLLDGFVNYSVANNTIVENKGVAVSYKVYVDVSNIVDMESSGNVDCLIIGTYAKNTKLYVMPVTVKLHVLSDTVKNTSDNNKFVIVYNILSYTQGIKGGTSEWGNLQ